MYTYNEIHSYYTNLRKKDRVFLEFSKSQFIHCVFLGLKNFSNDITNILQSVRTNHSYF